MIRDEENSSSYSMSGYHPDVYVAALSLKTSIVSIIIACI